MRLFLGKKQNISLFCRTKVTLSSIAKDLDDHVARKTPCIGDLQCNGNLSHLESPEDDSKLYEGIENSTNSLFEKIPLPKNPMEAALSKTISEQKAAKVNSVLVEAVRAKYRALKEMEIMEYRRTSGTHTQKRLTTDLRS